MNSPFFRLFSFFSLLLLATRLVAQPDMGGHVVIHADTRLLLLEKKTSGAMSESATGHSLTKKSPGTVLTAKQGDAGEAESVRPGSGEGLKQSPAKAVPSLGLTWPPVHHTPGSATKVPGFRVQLYNGPDRKKAEAIRAAFVAKYPHIPAYMVYVAPGFRVKVGNFTKRTDAESLLAKVKSISKPVMIVPDSVSP